LSLLNTVLAGCFEHKYIDRGLSLIENMKIAENMPHPDQVSYEIVLNGLCAARRVSRAIEIYE
jgi:pentatricopeptide repeat protein